MSQAALEVLIAVLESAPPGKQHWRTTGVEGVSLAFAHGYAYDWQAVPASATIATAWRGGCTWSAHGHAFELRPGSLMLLDAETPHRGNGYPDSAYAMVWADGFEPRWFGATQTPPDPEAHLALMDFAVSVVRNDPEERQRRTWLELVGLLRKRYPSPQTLDAGVRARLRRAERILRDARARPRLSAIAKDVGLSTEELVRQFRSAYGMPPAQYHLQRRFLEATLRIKRGSSITEAALAAGFADASHFSRLFKRQYRVSPSAWLALRRPPAESRRQ